MLGVRVYKNVQIDIWCGPSNDFISDRSLNLESHTSDDEILNFIKQSSPKIHIVIACQLDGLNPRKLFELIKQALNVHSAHSLPRRVTLISPDLEIYKSLQNPMFEMFPDGPQS